MLIPRRTDAPVYHWPYATVGLIAVNGLCSVIFGTLFWRGDVLRDWGLTRGEGLHPVQWITSLFLHDGYFQLLGNSLFLMTFGLVVEGKTGWYRFLSIYFVIGIVSAALLQVLGLGMPPVSFSGTSAILYGILAIGVLWAPDNEVEFYWILPGWGFVPRMTELTLRIRSAALWYLCWDLLLALTTRFQNSHILSHLVGAMVGAPLGWWLLEHGRVDCEGWDLFSRLEQSRKLDQKRARAEERRGALEEPFAPGTSAATLTPQVAVVVETGEKALVKLRKLLEERKGAAALALYEKISHVDKRWKLPEAELVQLIDLLHAESRWIESIPFLEEYLQHFEEQQVNLRLRLARILIEQQQRPNYALRVLADIPAAPLPDAPEKLRVRLREQAQQLIDEGVLELEGKAWE